MHTVLLPCTARYILGQSRKSDPLPQWVWLARLGIDNTLADALSHNNATLFLSKVPSAGKTATHVLQELMEPLASDPKARLDIPELFSTILNEV